MKSGNVFLVFFLLLTINNRLVAQNPTIVQYINTYKFLAIQEMKRTGVPAAIKLAQGILETQAGQSDLVMRSHNHFGIKCKSVWNGDKVYHDDDERGECFRAYASAEESYRDHSDFLKNSPRYASLFQIKPEDYKGWAQGLKKAGYATNPKYWQQLVKYIEDYDLNLYTQIALGKKQITDEAPMYASSGVAGTSIIAAAVILDEPADSFTTGNIQQETIVGADLPDFNYPDGIFEINSTRVIVAREGESLLAIAEDHHLRLKQLLDFNELSSDIDVLDKDQLIFLQRKRKQCNNDFTIVYNSESFYDVAQREGIRLDELLTYNFVDKGQQPTPGMKLFLKKDLAANSVRQAGGAANTLAYSSSGNASNKMTAKTEKSKATKHTVQTKETLYSIAKMYDVAVLQIKSWNNLQSDDLKIGQRLLIYKN